MQRIEAYFGKKEPCVDVVYPEGIVVANDAARHDTKGVDYQSVIRNHNGFRSTIAVALCVAKMNKQQEQK